MTVQLLTGRWRDVFEAMEAREVLRFTPVRISLGVPRYMPSGRGFPAIRELMPVGELFKLEGDEFDAGFRQHLANVGIDRIRERCEEVYAIGGKPLLLLCFENVQAGRRCHRITFGRWWMEQTGEIVSEVEPAQRD